ncbi:LPXTG cell wall anchor domain-containing protein [Rubrobacter radiotolerans]|uniref:LPXTG cell wall anchor domain-containing protein n=1 Tax=Rubrobacter radiotolerans TaxID=42256 RepID=A0AB35T1G5_RUBRA|nr:LPXTG cell wall anchor domain-containing protein [Rubrobacter radiotolerans]MDX5892916.1 LPXTG cell wall anchor domain-containing protein [Rubrobacter radiotolerans]
MTKVATLCLLAALSLALASTAAFAQDLDTPYCAIPEGCDLDGDGVAETPAGAIAPSGDQYSNNPPPAEAPQTEPVEQAGSGASEPSTTVSEVYPQFDESHEGGNDPVGSSALAPGGEVSTDVSPQPGSVAQAAAPSGLLPDTGGSSATLVASGALLLAGGLLVRKALR